MTAAFDLATTPIEDGITVVEASAGTGKTYCLTGLVLRLLLEERVRDVGEVLVVTFTNAAADELVTRLRGALRLADGLVRGEMTTGEPFFRHLAERYGGEDGRRILRRAVLDLDRLAVFTIHAFCKRVLEESAFESGVLFQNEFVDNDEPLLLAAAQDFWRRRLYCGGSELAAAVAAARHYTPETFLDAYRTWRRHPTTLILPPAAGLDASIAGLEEARAELARRWSRTRMRTLLAAIRYKKNAHFDESRLESILDDIEAFCRGGDPAGWRANGLLNAGTLKKWATKPHHPAIERHPIVSACGELEAAVQGFEHSLRVAFIAEVDLLFGRAKQKAGTLAFDDLLRQVHAALRDPVRGPALSEVVGRRYRAALVDEFQDTDLIQYEIFRRFFGRGPLYLIGDPKQAIYRFRGADVFAYMAAKSDADRGRSLERNWRSDPALLRAVNALFRRVPRAFVFAEIPFEEVASGSPAEREVLRGDGRPPLRWLWLPPRQNKVEATRAICRAVADEVVRLLEAGLEIGAPGTPGRPLEPADVAVLVRTNDQARAVQEALGWAGVPAVTSRAGDIFESEEMAELERLLAAVAEPASSPRLRAAWATRVWGDDERTILELNHDDERWQARLEELEGYRREWLRRGFMPMIQRLFLHRDVRPRLLSAEGGERRLTNLLHAVEVLHQAIRERHLSPAGLLPWLAAERAPGRVHDGETTELRLESDAQAVRVSTVHKSKGLEYGVVFCPFLWEARPESRPPVTAHVGPRRVVYDFGSESFDSHSAQAEAERLGEDLRLAYVAMTRARLRCSVVWGDVGRRSAASALGYLVGRAAEGLPAAEGPASDPVPAGDHARRAGERAERERPDWRRLLEDFVGRHREVMEIETIEAEPTPRRWIGAAEVASELVCPELPDLGPRRVPWRMISFSSLARGVAVAPEGGEIPDYLDPATPAPLRPVEEEPPPRGIFAFARGPEAGTCLHEVLERADFTAVESPETRRRIDEILRRHGLDDPSRHAAREPRGFDPAAAVAGMLRRVASAILPGTEFALADVPMGQRLVEWQFYAPFAGAAPRDLARLFRERARGAVAGEYAEHLLALDRREVHGFLTGFVDLIFSHGGRWYLVDWKSNHLGDVAADYGREGVWQAMVHHHYVLQYHLYVLALQRFLRSRLKGYDYERHFGGVRYVFLRGVGELADGQPTGWYADRPPRQLVDALEAFIDG